MQANHVSTPDITSKPALPLIHDWHRPRDRECAQNLDPEHSDCTCQRPRAERRKKPYRTVRVNEGVSARIGGTKVQPRLVLRVWPNGVIGIREHGRRREYLTTASGVLIRTMFADAMRAARIASEGKKKSGKKKTRQPARR